MLKQPVGPQISLVIIQWIFIHKWNFFGFVCLRLAFIMHLLTPAV